MPTRIRELRARISACSICNHTNKITDKNDISSLNEAAVAQHVGQKVSVKGKLIRLQNGRVGVIVNGKPSTQISIDPLPCPTLGEVTFKFEVKEYHQTTKKPKYHCKSPQNWIGTDARRKKLDHLIEQCEFGDSIELAGKLCHLTTTIIGNVQKNIGYPRIPESHFFFSIDDVTLIPTASHTQK